MAKPDKSKVKKHRDPFCPYSNPRLKIGGSCKCRPKPWKRTATLPDGRVVEVN